LMLVMTVTELIQMSRKSREADDWRDFSDAWAPRLDLNSRPYFDEKAGLIVAMTHACEQVYRQVISDPLALAEFDQFLRSQRWEVFDRLRHHLYAAHLDASRDYIRADIVAHA